MKITMIDDPIGEFHWTLLKKYADKLEASATEDDVKFVEHNLRSFLLLMLATLTASDKNKKTRWKKLMHQKLNDLVDEFKKSPESGE
jgi:hypothetical protein